MIADPNRYGRGPYVKSGPLPDFRTLPHFPGDSKPTFETLPYPSDRKKETYEECQSRQDPNVMNIMDPCRGLPHGGFKLPDLGADLEGYPSIPQGPSVGQELGKLAGMFLGDFIANRFGK
tara:strand:+ start:367 stop:726 length:360 start_codon:yes stop_codon:yes gene_type:complete